MVVVVIVVLIPIKTKMSNTNLPYTSSCTFVVGSPCLPLQLWLLTYSPGPPPSGMLMCRLGEVIVGLHERPDLQDSFYGFAVE